MLVIFMHHFSPAFYTRLQGITKSISRFPTAKRRFDDLVKSLSEELEKKMGGSQSGSGSRLPPRSRSGIKRMFSQKSFGRTISIQGSDQEAQSVNADLLPV